MNLLREIVTVKNAVIVLVVVATAFATFKFYEYNGKNLTWCSTHSLECQIARMENQKIVLESAGE